MQKRAFKTILLLVLLTICTQCVVSATSSDSWEVSMYFISLSSYYDENTPPPAPATYERVFGINSAATDDFDINIDRVAPPPPMDENALDVYFPCEHEVVTRLATDIKNKDANEWKLKLVVPRQANVTISWNKQSLPQGGEFIIFTGSSRIDMKSNDRVIFESGEHEIFIKKEVPPILCIPPIEVPSIDPNSSRGSVIELRNVTSNDFIERIGIEKYEYIIRANENATRAVNISVNISLAPPESIPELSNLGNGVLPDFYYKISIDQEDNWYEDISEIHLRIYYNRSRIHDLGIDESSLRPVRYTAGEWIKLDTPSILADGTELFSSGVMMEGINPYIWANISRFSIYGVAGKIIQSDNGSGSSGGGGSGGGGGGSGGERYENIAVVEVISESVLRDQLVKYHLSNEDIVVNEIAFNALQNLATLKLRVEVLHGRSQFAESDPSGSVYKHVNIWFDRSGFTEGQHFKDAKIFFKVEKQWLEDNKVNANSIRLNRYHNKEWNELNTEFIRSDDISYYYVAETPGFSPFSITGKTDLSNVNKDEEFDDVLLADIDETATNGLKIQNYGNSILIYGFVIMLMMIGTGYFIITRQKKKN